MNAYPLQFEAVLKERIWGGRALARFGMDLPEGSIGEGWMISDHPNGQTKVMNGPLAGQSLEELGSQFGAAWFGENGFSKKTGRFSLLIKLLDCNDDLSIQVHPDDNYSYLPDGELGKTEMWYIIDAKPNASIIYGLKEHITKADFEQAVADGKIMETMQAVHVQKGDAFYIPAGTVHALCSGVVVAEIQQNSDTTYRLYDYERPGLDGKLRELHMEDSLRVIAYGDSGATRMSTNNASPGEWLEIASSPYFKVFKGIVNQSWTLSTRPESCEIIAVVEGNGSLQWEEGSIVCKPGDFFLLPSSLGKYTLDGEMTVLQSIIP